MDLLSQAGADIFGSGLVRFTSNKSIPIYYGHWWGIVGDNSTDDSTALNAALAALPNGATFSTVNLHMAIASTITLYSIDMELSGSTAARQVGQLPPSSAASLRWTGSAGGTVMKCQVYVILLCPTST
jgi:hypothetical protein